MREEVLQHIWRFGLFHQEKIKTIDGKELSIQKRGNLNTNAGPDFLNAIVDIEGIKWAGNVELHIKTSDWDTHKHSHDAAYGNVILHVVYEHNLSKLPDGIPVLELKDLIHSSFLSNFQSLMSSKEKIPCGRSISNVPKEKLNWWLERLLIERLEGKTDRIFHLLNTNSGNWEETTFQMVARYFGAPLNAEPFEQLARHLAVTTVLKERSSQDNVEALFFGTANLLPEHSSNVYVQKLTEHARHLLKKHSIQKQQPGIYSFFRVRPAGFPTVRMAQLAALMFKSPALFSQIISMKSAKDWKAILQLETSDFWRKHYKFDETEHHKPLKASKHLSGMLLINVVAPIAYAYGMQTGNQDLKEYALRILEELNVEKNIITRTFSSYGLESTNAFQSQALIELKTSYCDKLNCLNCVIGNEIIGK